jgi:hypothetical protein
MGILAEGLRPFVDNRMSAAFPKEEDWVLARAARSASSRSDGLRYSLSDPRFLLRVLTEEWRLFKDHLSRVEQGFATELRDAGNRWAHGEPLSAEDAYRTLDTMERLLTAVGAASQASQVRSLRLELQPATQAAATHDGGPTERLRVPSLESAKRTGGFWSPVTHADVVRAIEDYDRLGQEQFLAEHGFGRATAYLLIYRGRGYDSKAILGVAYRFATGMHIGAHDFSGGIYGAAGVLRNLGFEIRNIRSPGVPGTGDRVSTNVPVALDTATAGTRRGLQPSDASLAGISPEGSLLVVTCSGRKASGGQTDGQADAPGWPQDLLDARAHVLATAKAEISLVLPAWRRYTGTFYQHARRALDDAVMAAHVVIISGGYGVVWADEPIGWYDKMLQLSDWPAGVLESALIGAAERCETQTVVAFASATTDYARLLRRTRWVEAGIDARLVTITGVTGGVMSEVPRQLAQAFSTFWNGASGYPPGMTVEILH